MSNCFFTAFKWAFPPSIRRTSGISNPISVLDYTSLYPSSIRSKNLSHETFINIKNNENIEDKIKRLEELGYQEYINNNEQREYYNGNKENKKMKFYRKVKITDNKTYIFVENEKKGIIPTILKELMDHRKNTKKLMKKVDKKSFRYDLLDSQQLAYKLTANSIYGQMGSKYSQVFKKEIAESTTAVGREQLELAKKFVLNSDNFKDYNKDIVYNHDVVYGDTDSIFVKYDCRDNKGNIIKDSYKLREESIRLGKYTEEKIGEFVLEKPQILEYEKTFHPFILLGKKKYIGIKYEEADDNPKQTNMGVVLKRRDNALILKIIYDGIINKLMNDKCILNAKKYLVQELQNLIDGKYDMSKLTITKRLNATYKDRTKIAHAVLADRIGVRDPGNKPTAGDRIPFVHIYKENKKDLLQGDLIEIPDYIKKENLEIDYEYYITNQLEKPISQLLSLCDLKELFNQEIEDKIIKLSNDKVVKYSKKKIKERDDGKYSQEEIDIKIIEYEKKEKEKLIGKELFEHYINLIKEKQMGSDIL